MCVLMSVSPTDRKWGFKYAPESQKAVGDNGKRDMILHF